jgi:glucose/arabinose dehydrogenase
LHLELLHISQYNIHQVKEYDRVYAVIDNNKDKVSDETVTISTGLNSPNGVAYKDGDLYVAEIGRIIMFQDIINNLYDASYEVVFDGLPKNPNHGWKYIAFGPDGLLYIPIGAPCNVCDEEGPYATLNTLDIETGEFRKIASGIRNTVGFDWNPDDGSMWFTDNGRDWLGNDIPPDELNLLESGSHYGFPYCHGKDIADPEFNDRECTEFNLPEVELGPHVAALGMEFYDENIFIAEHGSWNRDVPIGYRITIVNPNTLSYDVFAEGWLSDEKVYGRPVDIEISKGDLFVFIHVLSII